MDVFEGVLTGKVCKKIISTFLCESKVEQGRTGLGHAYAKQCTEFCPEPEGKWRNLLDEMDRAVYASVRSYIRKYRALENLGKAGKLEITKPQIQHYRKGTGRFDWHIDSHSGDARVITGILYLNDVKEGGETSFGKNFKFKPQEGSAMLFPPYWTHLHKGEPPLSSDKFIMTWFVEFNPDK